MTFKMPFVDHFNAVFPQIFHNCASGGRVEFVSNPSISRLDDHPLHQQIDNGSFTHIYSYLFIDHYVQPIAHHEWFVMFIVRPLRHMSVPTEFSRFYPILSKFAVGLIQVVKVALRICSAIAGLDDQALEREIGTFQRSVAWGFVKVPLRFFILIISKHAWMAVGTDPQKRVMAGDFLLFRPQKKRHSCCVLHFSGLLQPINYTYTVIYIYR